MVTVACLLWGSWGDGHGIEYVHKLRDRVHANMTHPHRFVCFSDRDIPDVETIRFTPRFRWNLNKMVLYHPDNGLQGRVLAFDLDIVPMGNLDDFAAYDGRFAVCESFNPRFEGLAGGSIMGFEAGTLPFLWDDLVACPGKWTDRTGGAERLYYRMHGGLNGCDFWQRLLPGQIASYKRHCQEGVPDGTRVIVYHGRPRPHEVGF